MKTDGGHAGRRGRRVPARRVLALGLTALALIVTGGSTPSARPGDPDLGFASASTLKDTAIGAEEADAALLLSDGRIVVAGYRTSGGTTDFLLARYNASGGIDNSFGALGKTFTNVGSSGSNDFAHALASHADGRLVAAGEADNGANRDFALTRYSAVGVIDGAFDGDGKVLTDIGGFNDEAHGVVVQADDDVVAVGRSFNGTDSDVAVVRYNNAGTPQTTTVTDVDDEGALAAVLQSSDFTVAAGYAGTSADHDLALFRYKADGTIDTTSGFGGGDGIATTAVGGGNDELRAIAAQSDGKLVAAGTTDNGADDDIVVARFNTDGTLDSSFDGDGIVTTSVAASTSDQANAIAVQPDGRIVVVGTTATGADSNVVVVRYNSDGSLDSATFGSGGMVVRGGPHADEGRAVLVQSDTRMVVSGSFDRGVDPALGLLRALGQTVSIDDTAVLVPGSGTAVARFTVSLAVPGLDTVTVDWGTSNGSAAAGVDYVGAGGTLTFTPGVTSRTVDITVLPSGVVEPDQIFFVNLSAPTRSTVFDGTGVATLINKKATKYWMVASDGGIFSFNAPFFGSMGGLPLNKPIVGMAARQDGNGYWMVASDGGIFSFNAPFFGSMGGLPLNKPIVGMAASPFSSGYWMVASDGGIFSFNAPFFGSMGGLPLNKPIVGMTPSPFTGGYWMVASDGGIFSFNAPFFGSMGGLPLNKPIVGMAASTATGGYWMVASDGGIFSFNAPFFGSMGGLPLASPIVGMAGTPSGNGYWLFAGDGGVFAFGDAQFSGSMGGIPLAKPVVGGAGGGA